MGAGDNKKVCCGAANAPQDSRIEKTPTPTIGKTDVFQVEFESQSDLPDQKSSKVDFKFDFLAEVE